MLFNCVALNPRTDNSLGFTVPFANGIYVVSPELRALSEVPPYYGDTMTFASWKALPLKLGVGCMDATHTLVSGYTYKYNVTRGTFIITDSTGKIVYSVSNVKSVDDMSIDFTIIHSHQFKVVFEGGDVDIPFFLPTKFNKPNYDGLELETNSSIPFFMSTEVNKPSYDGLDSRIRTFVPFFLSTKFNKPDYDGLEFIVNSMGSLEDKSLSLLKFLGRYDDDSLFQYKRYIKMFDKDIYTGINRYNINFNKLYMDGLFYNKTSESLCATYVNKLYRARALVFNYYLFALMSLSIYPIEQPTQQYGESNNNRPVYEPWLIWGFFKFLAGKRTTDDGDDYLIDVFDLSPVY